MIIAIPSNDDKGLESTITPHFGQARHYTFVKVGKEIEGATSVPVPFDNHGPGDIPNFVKQHGGNFVIAYGMGGRAVDFFNQMGIKVILGASGVIKDVINQFLSENLEVNEDWEMGGDFHKHEH